MKLAQVFKLEGATNVVLIGKPELSNLVTSDEEPYYICKLQNPATVRCSVDPAIDPIQVDEVYVRKSALDEEGWQLVDENDPEKGFFMDGWKLDFSKGQEIVIYQETTIAKWARENRGVRRDDRRKSINDRIKERMKNKK